MERMGTAGSETVGYLKRTVRHGNKSELFNGSKAVLCGSSYVTPS